jgi:hypothetical protein
MAAPRNTLACFDVTGFDMSPSLATSESAAQCDSILLLCCCTGLLCCCCLPHISFALGVAHRLQAFPMFLSMAVTVTNWTPDGKECSLVRS